MQRSFDRIAVLAFVGAWVCMTWRFIAGADLSRLTSALASPLAQQPTGETLTIALAVGVTLFSILAGYGMADFLAGSVHWLADRFFSPTTPILGEFLIAPFREHHADMREMSRHDFFEVSGNNAFVTLPVVIGMIFLPAPHDLASLAIAAFCASLTAALFATNQFHAWAHAEAPPRIARRLQAMGLILTPERHARHHCGDHDRSYCVTSGWLNPLLDQLRIFEHIESIVSPGRSQRRRIT